MMNIEGNIVDVFKRQIYYGHLWWDEGKIVRIDALDQEQKNKPYIMPGFVDAHVHIESSMLTPAHFARLAVVHGTVGTVSDPHEIGNVLGQAGVEYMLEDAAQSPFHFAFGAPSCVPATAFETAGATIDSDQIAQLMARPDIYYLAEMMNYPGVIYEDEEVIKKLMAATKSGKPIDGHAPGLRGSDTQKYFAYGISTDHECYQTDEAAEKLGLGVKILVREGSAAKNFNALMPLAIDHSQHMMFCSDDKHPDELVLGHINVLVKRAIKEFDLPLFDALYMACVHPVKHYQLPIGLLREGDPADFIVVKDLIDFEVAATYLSGDCVARDGVSLLPLPQSMVVNYFNAQAITVDQIRLVVPEGTSQLRAIHATGGQLITQELLADWQEGPSEFISDAQNDLLKLVVYNRYTQATPAVAIIHGFGLARGAIASSVAHDSHNIIAVGVSDEDLVDAINAVVSCKGGVVATYNKDVHQLALPVAGLMSNEDGYKVATDYQAIDVFAKKELGSALAAPFMTLSFMALLVIPRLKLSDKGLFDGATFTFTSPWLP